MIIIIAGKRKTGKTAKLKQLYELDHKGDGYIAEKFYQDGKAIGYELVLLSTGERVPFKIKDEYYAYQGIYDKEFKMYHYSSDAYKTILDKVKYLVKNKITPIYLDGVGDLELLKKGNDEAFLYCLKHHVDVVITTQDTVVRNLINHYRLKDYKIIGLKK